MASDDETFDEVFAEAMNRKAVRDYRMGISNGMKLSVVRCAEDVVDHYAMRFRDAHDREVAELRECLARRSSHLNAILQKAIGLREDVPAGLRKVMDECIVAEDKAVGLGVFSIRKGPEDETK